MLSPLHTFLSLSIRDIFQIKSNGMKTRCNLFTRMTSVATGQILIPEVASTINFFSCQTVNILVDYRVVISGRQIVGVALTIDAGWIRADIAF